MSTDPNTPLHHPDPGNAACANNFVPTARPVVSTYAEMTPILAVDAGIVRARPVQSMPMPMSRLRAVIELLVLLAATIGGSVAVALVVSTIPALDHKWRMVAITGGAAIVALVTCFTLLAIAGHKPLTIGWRWDRLAGDVAIGLAATVITYFVLFSVAIVLILINPDLLRDRPAAQQAIEENIPRTSLPNMMLMMAFVALWEEVIFRGFLLTRLYAIVRRWWLAILIATALFGTGHFYEGRLALGLVTVLGLLLSILFVWRKSLVAPMVLHAAFNTIALALLHLNSDTWR